MDGAVHSHSHCERNSILFSCGKYSTPVWPLDLSKNPLKNSIVLIDSLFTTRYNSVVNKPSMLFKGEYFLTVTICIGSFAT